VGRTAECDPGSELQGLGNRSAQADDTGKDQEEQLQILEEKETGLRVAMGSSLTVFCFFVEGVGVGYQRSVRHIVHVDVGHVVDREASHDSNHKDHCEPFPLMCRVSLHRLQNKGT